MTNLVLNASEYEAFVNSKTNTLNYYAYKEYSNTTASMRELNSKKVIISNEVCLENLIPISGKEFLDHFYEFGKFTHACLWIPYMQKTFNMHISKAELLEAIGNNYPAPINYSRDYYNQSREYRHISEESKDE